MQAALERLWPFTHELFESDGVSRQAAQRAMGPDPATLEPEWHAGIARTLTEATLTFPEPGWRPSGGRSGLHTEAFGYMLAEMQHLHRSHPGARW